MLYQAAWLGLCTAWKEGHSHPGKEKVPSASSGWDIQRGRAPPLPILRLLLVQVTVWPS